MRLWDRTVAQQISEMRNIGVVERKNAQFTTVLPFLGNFFLNINGFWPILFVQNFWSKILVAQRNLLLKSLHTRHSHEDLLNMLYLSIRLVLQQCLLTTIVGHKKQVTHFMEEQWKVSHSVVDTRNMRDFIQKALFNGPLDNELCIGSKLVVLQKTKM